MTDGAESCAVGLTGCDGQICLEIRTRSAMVCFGSLRIGVAFSEAKVCRPMSKMRGFFARLRMTVQLHQLENS